MRTGLSNFAEENDPSSKVVAVPALTWSVKPGTMYANGMFDNAVVTRLSASESVSAFVAGFGASPCVAPPFCLEAGPVYAVFRTRRPSLVLTNSKCA